jgi:hypothetical protein
MNLPAIGNDLAFQLFKQLRQIADDIFFHLAHLGAQPFAIHRIECRDPLDRHATGGARQGRL